MLRNILIISMVICLPIMAISSEHQWTSLEGPYWANGIDVAVGDKTTQPGNRYLIGSDNNSTKLYSWSEVYKEWQNPDEYPNAKKVISYKHNDNGDYAFAAVYEGQILKTINGGLNWDPAGAPVNSKYTTIEIINDEIVGEHSATVLVGCEPDGNNPTAFYSLDAGGTWSRLGGDEINDPIYGLHIYDLETIGTTTIMAGTESGLYSHATAAYSTEWDPVAFDGLDVVALESVDLLDDEQMACVITGQGPRLYYTDDGWDNYQQVEVNGSAFNKEVRDMAGIYWNDPATEWKSFYLATEEGFYLLSFRGSLSNVRLQMNLDKLYLKIRDTFSISKSF